MELILSFLFGTIGTGYFVYGKKQHNGVALFSGVGLMVFPMMISGVGWLVLGCLVFMALPFLIAV